MRNQIIVEEPPKTYTERTWDQVTEAERFGMEAHKHSDNCKQYIVGAIVCSIVGFLLVGLIAAITLPFVNLPSVIKSWGVIALAVLSAVMVFVAIILAALAKREHALSYENLLKRDRMLPKETPVLVRMVN